MPLESLLTNMEKKSEKAIENRLIGLQSVFDGISEPWMMVDSGMVIKMINRAALAYYGYDEKTMGSQENTVNAVEKTCYQALMHREFPCPNCEVISAVADGHSAKIERRCPNNYERWEQIFIYPVKETASHINGAVIRFCDVSENKRLQKRMIHKEKLATAGILTSGITHEINNPNNFITFNIPILRQYLQELMPTVDAHAEKNPDFKPVGMSYPELRRDIFEILDNIEYGASRINGIIKSLRMFGRVPEIEDHKWFDLNESIRNSIELCRNQAGNRIEKFNIDLPEDLHKIYSSPSVIEQVLVNLLVNAIHAADKQNALICVNARVQGAFQNRLVLEVMDNGCGMDEKTQKKLFQPFFSTKPRDQGTGLGLFICQNLIEGLAGRIEYESRAGEGTVFRVFLPVETLPASERHRAMECS